MTVSECCLIKLLAYILFEKYIYILALEMASPGNQQCANCIDTLSFPMALTLSMPVGHTTPACDFLLVFHSNHSPKCTFS